MDPKLTKDLDAIVHQIVVTASPSKVVLFGDAVRLPANPHGELDFLVIVHEVKTRNVEVIQDILVDLYHAGFGANVVVMTEEEVEWGKDDPNLFLHRALEEGIPVYELAKCQES